MMHRNLNLLFLALLIGSPGNLRAQLRDIQFKHLSVEEGLSQSTIYAMSQDNNGFLWIGTQSGLNRYDGHAITIFETDINDSNSISHYCILAIHKTPNGLLWIGTQVGLNRYNPETNQFKRFFNHKNDSNSLSDNWINAICEDRFGNLWIGTNKGLDKFEVAKNRFIHYKSRPNQKNNLSSDKILSLCFDRYGILWFGTYGGGLNTLNEENGNIEVYQNDPNDSLTLSNNIVQSLAEDTSGNIWIGTDGGGLNKFERNTKTFRSYTNHPGNSKSISDNRVNVVYIDRENVLWIGTNDGGLNVFDKEKEEFFPYQYRPEEFSSLTKNRIASIFEDNLGGIWIGTYGGGINLFNKKSHKFNRYLQESNNKNSLSYTGIRGIFEDRDGLFWIGTDNKGVNKFDRKANKFIHFQNNPLDSFSLSPGQVRTIGEDSSGNLWIGTTGGGLNKFDRSNGRFYHFRNNPTDPSSLSNDNILSMLFDGNGTIWVGTKGGGLNKFDPQTHQFSQYRYDMNNNSSLSNDNVWCIFEDRSGFLWVGTYDGLNQFDPKTQQFKRFFSDSKNIHTLSDNWIASVMESESGKLWISTKFGLNRMEPKSGICKQYTKKNGLPDNSIYAVLEDSQGNLWMSTNRGISKLNPKTEKFKNFGYGDGLQGSEFNGSSYFKSKTGEMFFGGVNGFNSFFPDSIQSYSPFSSILISDFKIWNASVPVGKMPDGRTILAKVIEETPEVTLSYKENMISFEFTIINFISSEKNQFAYRLEGLEKEWIYAGSRRFVTYSNLKPGKYVLRFKGSTNEDNWTEGKPLKIVITPHFSQTTWFKGLSLLLIILGLAYLFKFRTSIIKQKLEKKKLENELKLKADFTAMLVHDLRNPLLCVSGYSDLLKMENQDKIDTKFCDSITDSVNVMVELINDMLDIYKYEAKKMSIKKEKIVLSKVVEEIIRLMKPLLSNKSLQLIVTFKIDTPLQADPTQIGRVLNNLLSNAIKFSPKNGGITISISSITFDNKLFQEITIGDEGPGIESAKQGRLFSPYSQIEDKDGVLQRGTGLGLAVSKLIVEAHGGVIGYKKIENIGSEFTFRLPVG